MAARVLVCDDEASLRQLLEVLLRRAGYRVDTVGGVAAARARIKDETPYDAVITDLAMPDGRAWRSSRRSSERDDALQVIMITAFATHRAGGRGDAPRRLRLHPEAVQEQRALAQLEKALEKRSIVHENRALRAQVTGNFGSANRRQGPGDAGGDGAGAPRRAAALERAHHRRERHRQGGRRARAARNGRPRATAVHRRSTAARCPRT